MDNWGVIILCLFIVAIIVGIRVLKRKAKEKKEEQDRRRILELLEWEEEAKRKRQEVQAERKRLLGDAARIAEEKAANLRRLEEEREKRIAVEDEQKRQESERKRKNEVEKQRWLEEERQRKLAEEAEQKRQEVLQKWQEAEAARLRKLEDDRQKKLAAEAELRRRELEQEKARERQKAEEVRRRQLEEEKHRKIAAEIEQRKRDAERKEKEAEHKRRELEAERPRQVKANAPADPNYDILVKRGVKWLYHFTNIRNLSQIAEYGLLSRKMLQNRGMTCHSNDVWEDRSEHLSLSIEWPNYKMLYYLQNTYSQEEYVILCISIEILLVRKYEMYATNERKNWGASKVDDAEKLFYPAESRNSLDDKYPTDPQAELRIKDSVPIEYIRAVYVKNMQNVDAAYISESLKEKMRNSTQLFAARTDWRYW